MHRKSRAITRRLRVAPTFTSSTKATEAVELRLHVPEKGPKTQRRESETKRGLNTVSPPVPVFKWQHTLYQTMVSQTKKAKIPVNILDPTLCEEVGGWTRKTRTHKSKPISATNAAFTRSLG